jgi:hypothetical protein
MKRSVQVDVVKNGVNIMEMAQVRLDEDEVVRVRYLDERGEQIDEPKPKWKHHVTRTQGSITEVSSICDHVVNDLGHEIVSVYGPSAGNSYVYIVHRERLP